MRKIFVYRSHLTFPVHDVFSWHMQPDALERLQPPWDKAEVVKKTGPVSEVGSQVTLRVKIGPISQTLVSEHTAFEPDKMFRDTMVRGPFPFWEHTHSFEADGPGESWLEDRVECEIPFGWLGNLIAGRYLKRRLTRLFVYRHQVTAESLAALHAR